MACLEEADRAQHARMDGKLGAARSDLLACTNVTCPAIVRRDCVRWLDEVEEEMPSILIDARDETGALIVDGVLSIDGAVVADRLDGKPLFVDAGTHRLAVARPGHSTIERSVEVRKREKRRRIDFNLGPKDAAEESKGLRPVTVAGISFLTAGGVALGVGTALAISVLSSPCSDGAKCSLSDQESANRAGTASNVVFIGGAVAVVTGVALLAFFKK